jgi:hypothetical protein
MDNAETLKNIENRLTALVSLMSISILGSETEKAGIKPEVLLFNAGLDYAAIAKILGKKSDAVRMIIQRNKK